MKKIIFKIMNRLIRNRDILVIILLIVIICLFNFHFSQGDGSLSNRSPKIPSNSNLKFQIKQKPSAPSDDDKSNVSQLSTVVQNASNDSLNQSISIVDLQTTLPPIDLKLSFLNELSSAKDYRKICGKNRSPIRNLTLDDELFQSNDQIECPSRSFIVFLVVSDINNFDLRDKIRQSWSSMRQLHESKLTTLFFVHSSKPLTDKQKSDLKHENNQYFDVVFVSSSFNVKTEVDFYLKMFQFVTFSCFKTEYFVLINDATFINLPTLFEAILTNRDIKSRIEEKKSLMLCRVKKNVIAVRNKKSSWFVTTQDWPEKHYPPYCDLSNGVIMSQQVVHDLLMCSVFEKRFWINDVFVTGILPQKMSINVEAFMEDFSTNIMKYHYIYDDLSRSIFLTEGMPYNVRVWRLLFSKSLKEF